MTLPSVGGIVKEIEQLTLFLVGKGFADDQNYAYREDDGIHSIVTFPNANLAAMLKNRPYAEIYETQRNDRAFNVRMLDGALIQMNYEFVKSGIERCRLAFLPSPSLVAYQNDPELYEEDLIYAEVVHRQVMPVPIRFDFDSRIGIPSDVDHPLAHLTLGQYKNCRIATTAPITPGVFIEFILRGFYNTAKKELGATLPGVSHRWEQTITKAESALVHIAVP